jgi:proteasome lid subunit RPN8/RPN11
MRSILRRAQPEPEQAPRNLLPSRSPVPLQSVTPLRPAKGWQAAAAATAAVLVRPEVLRTIAVGAARAGDDETGGPFFGTVQRTWDADRYRLVAALLGTLPPGPAVAGGPGSVGLGARSDGERAASALRWLRETTGLDLLHVGDWHRHPFGSPQPSGGDRRTAREMWGLTAAPLWLAAIAVDEATSEQGAGAEDNVVTLTRSQRLSQEIHFYQECEPRGLVPVRVRIDAETAPKLPPLPWYIADPARFAAECRLLLANGFRPALQPVMPGARPAVVLRLERDGGEPLTVETGLRHPYEEPLVRDAKGRRIRLRPAWSAERFIVDLLREVA